MKYGRRSTDFPKSRLITGAFYYIALSMMLSALTIAVYWQLQADDIELGFVELEHVSTPADRAFFVPITFCSDKLTEFTVIRYYHDIDRNIYYGVPDGKYKTSKKGCFDNRLQANAGRLDAGNYEYHVSVSYDLNPLRTEQRKVAIVRLRIE
jgi:hypothetical protein